MQVNAGRVGWQCSVFKSHSDAGLKLDLTQLRELLSQSMEFAHANKLFHNVTVSFLNMEKVRSEKDTLQQLFRYAKNVTFAPCKMPCHANT